MQIPYAFNSHRSVDSNDSVLVQHISQKLDCLGIWYKHLQFQDEAFWLLYLPLFVVVSEA